MCSRSNGYYFIVKIKNFRVGIIFKHFIFTALILMLHSIFIEKVNGFKRSTSYQDDNRRISSLQNIQRFF